MILKNQNSIRCAGILLATFLCIVAHSQNGVAINTTGAAADNSAILDLRNNVSKGLLLPQVSSTSLVTSPYEGLVVYQNSGTKGIYYYTGSTWILLSSSTGTITAVNASLPLSSSGGTAPTISLTGIVPIANGGTNIGTIGANGSIIYSNGTQYASLAPGSNGQVLTSNGSSAPTWSTPTTGTLTGTGTATQVAFWSSATGLSSNANFYWDNINSRLALGSSTSPASTLTVTGDLTSSAGAINLNSPATGSSAFATNINTGINTGTVIMGGTGPQTISIGNNFLSAGPNIVNVGTAGDGSNSTINVAGITVNVNNVTQNNRTTNIGGSGTQAINLGASTTGVVTLGGISTSTTNINSVSTAPSGAVNINYNNSKPININAGTSTGQVIIGGSSAQSINVGTGVTGNSVVALGSGGGDANSTTTNIKSGTGGVNINAGVNQPTNINTGTSNKDVTIGNSLNNVNLPRLSVSSVVLTDASKNLTSTTPTSNTYLFYNGTNFTWTSAASLGTFSATLPLTYNNSTGVFAINKATTSSDGYLSLTDWNTFNNKVSSITLNTPSSVFSNPLNFSVTSGAATGTLSLNTQTANTFFAGPASGAAAAPTFRTLVAADLATALGNSYILNQTAQQPLSNFNISANGVIGGSLTVAANTTNTGNFTSSGGAVNLNSGTSTGGVNIGGTGTQTIALGSTGTTSATNIISGSGGVNINTGTNTGTVTIGGNGNQTINIGSTITNGSINLGNSANDPVATNILGGINGGVNINNNVNKNLPTNINTGSTTGNITIGSTGNNLIFPKFTTNGTIFYTTGGTGTVSGLTPGSNGNVLTLSGGLPTWVSPATSGTVTSFSSGNLSPLFTTSVATPATTPALSFTLSSAAAHAFFGNFTDASAPPSFSSPKLASADFANQGTTTAVLHGSAAGNPSWGAINLASDVSGIVSIANGGTNIGTIGSAGSVMYSNGTQHASTAVGTAGQVLTSAGSGIPVWTTPAAGTVTSVTATSPLSNTGTATAPIISVTGIVPIANGGTNSSTALSGSSIMVSNGTAVIQGEKGTTTTVLHGNASGTPAYSAVALASDVSGILPVSNGGTGISTAAANTVFGNFGSTAAAPSFNAATGDNQFLVKRGALLIFGTINAADLPSLPGSYIQNQTTPQASSNFNISGNGIIGTNLSVTGNSTLTGAVISNGGVTNTGVLISSGAAITLNNNSNFSTNINTGTSTGTVTIGNAANNINLPKLTASSVVLTDATKNLTSSATLPIANGGTNSTAMPTNGGVAYGTGTAYAFTTSGTTGQVLTSNGAAAPTWADASGGTVASFGTAGSLSPLFTTSVSNPTSTPVLTFTASNAAAHIFFGNFTGSSTTPSFSSPSLASADFANQGTTTTVLHGDAAGNPSWSSVNLTSDVSNILPIANGGTNIGTIGTAGSVIFSNGTQHSSTAVGTAGQVLTSAGSGTPVWATAADGTVTSFSSGNLSPLFITSIASSTSTPALSFALSNQNANLVFAGPASGAAAAPTFRGLVAADLPAGSGNYVQSQSASSQNAGYWINGPANIGTATFNSSSQLDVVNTNTSGTGVSAAGEAAGVYAKYTTAGAGGAAIYTENSDATAIVRVNYFDATTSTQYKIIGDGTVSTTAENLDNNSKVVLHAPEAPEILFEDYGEGKLVNGKTHIDIDPVFSKNVAINDKHPLRVFIQLEGDCNGVYVANKSKTGFDVVELQKGNSNVSFQWHIVCNRANENLGGGKISHNEDSRFEKAPGYMQNTNSVSRQVIQKAKKN